MKGNVFAIDATTIDLCLSTFYWASFRSTKAGIKLHTQIDLKTSIPEFILFTNTTVHDVNVLDVINFESNSFYIMDRGYIDYKRLYKIHLCGAFFFTRAKDNRNYRWLYSHPKNKIILGALRKCPQNSSVDCYSFLYFSSHCQEAVYAQTKPPYTIFN